MPKIYFLKDEKNLEKKCGDDNSGGNLIIKLEKSLIDELDSKTINKSISYLNYKLDSNPICKTNFLVSRLDDYLNNKMMKDELRDDFNFKKKSSNHIIRNCKDNVYCIINYKK